MNHQVLKVYFDRSGLPLEGLEKKVSPKFSQFLTGEAQPSFNQLEKTARIFDIPLGLLFLDEAVAEKKTKLKFRTINSHPLAQMSLELRDTIAEMKEKQDFLKEQVEGELNFIGKFSISDNYLQVAKYIRQVLALPQNYYASVSRHKQLSYLRNKINQIGVFIFFNGKIRDNTHRPLNLEEFRGFDLVDKKAPLIFVNQKDTRNGQVFTLIHELVHLFIGDEEILGTTSPTQEFDATEAFVNKVTAELLVPNQDFQSAYHENVEVAALANKFKVSEFVIARRMLDNKYLSLSQYQRLISNLTKQFKQLQKAKGNSGGSYTNNVKFRIDKNFFRYVDNALAARQISFTDAFNIVGVGYKGYHILQEGV